MDSNRVKDRILNEYYKLFEFVQKYDEYFLRTKTWSITAGSASLVLGFRYSNRYIFIASGLLALSFWIIEIYFKIIQDSHIARLREIENCLKSKEIPDTFYPQILSSYVSNWRLNMQRNRWVRFTFRLSVMLPHALILIFSIIGIAKAYQTVHSVG